MEEQLLPWSDPLPGHPATLPESKRTEGDHIFIFIVCQLACAAMAASTFKASEEE